MVDAVLAEVSDGDCDVLTLVRDDGTGRPPHVPRPYTTDLGQGHA